MLKGDNEYERGVPIVMGPPEVQRDFAALGARIPLILFELEQDALLEHAIRANTIPRELDERVAVSFQSPSTVRDRVIDLRPVRQLPATVMQGAVLAVSQYRHAVSHSLRKTYRRCVPCAGTAANESCA